MRLKFRYPAQLRQHSSSAFLWDVAHVQNLPDDQAGVRRSRFNGIHWSLTTGKGNYVWGDQEVLSNLDLSKAYMSAARN